MNNMIFKKKEQCCGCGACAQVCKFNAIEMKEDMEGFLYPHINDNICTNCNECKRICPVRNKQNVNKEIKSCYICFDKDYEKRKDSSSGGVFSILAEKIINANGIVAGAAFDNNFGVYHIYADNTTDLSRIKGSKYVQSRMDKIYYDVESHLKKGKKVLFSGVECQVAGLLAYLGKDYSNLITVGVLCHGVPSPKVWESYLKWQTINNSSIRDISFRDKESGWKNYSVRVVFEDSTVYKKKFYDDKYMNMFLGNICLRPSCYDCKFKNLNRISDITLGDCWGIENYMPEMDDDKGTSVVLVHSIKGQEYFNQIISELKYCEADVEKALSKNPDARNSVAPHINRKKFLKKLSKNRNFEELIDCLNISMIARIKRKIINILIDFEKK